MAMQQGSSDYAKRLGARVAQANAEHKDKPVDTGMKRLPAGVKAGVAKLQFMYTKKQDKDDGKIPKGEDFFRASAVVLGKMVNGVLVKEHNGENIEGTTTSVVIPLCDIPAKGMRKEVTFSENWFEFQNLFKKLSNGSIACHETPQTDPTGLKVVAFYDAAMAALTNPKHPIYVEFSTRGWTPPASAAQPKPEEMVFEEWHGPARPPSNGQHDPAAGMTQGPPQHTTSTFHPADPPPSSYDAAVAAQGRRMQETHNQTQTAPARGAAPPPNNGPPPQYQPNDNDPSGDDGEILGLVEIAMEDPEGNTADGSAASQQLEEMAWARGWTKQQTSSAADWSVVGQMALSSSTDMLQTTKTALEMAAPKVGSRFMYAKRTKDGVKYKDNKGQEFPAQECEVTSVNPEAKTCTLKTVHDGKDVTDIRTKKQVDVKLEWLEQAPPF